MSNITTIPNSFPTPHIFVDLLMPYIKPTEYVVLSYAVRHILGFHEKRVERQGHISLSTFENGYGSYPGCGLGRTAIKNALKTLQKIGVLIALGEPGEKGQRWQIASSIDQATLDTLKTDAMKQTKANKKRTKAATQASLEKRGLTSDVTPKEGVSHDVGGTSDVTGGGTSDVTNQSNSQSNLQSKSLDASASGDEKPPAPKFDFNQAVVNIQSVFKVRGQQEKNILHMLKGTSKQKAYKPYNIPENESLKHANEILYFAKWYQNECPGVSMPTSPEKLESHWLVWRAETEAQEKRKLAMMHPDERELYLSGKLDTAMQSPEDDKPLWGGQLDHLLGGKSA